MAKQLDKIILAGKRIFWPNNDKRELHHALINYDCSTDGTKKTITLELPLEVALDNNRASHSPPVIMHYNTISLLPVKQFLRQA